MVATESWRPVMPGKVVETVQWDRPLSHGRTAKKLRGCGAGVVGEGER